MERLSLHIEYLLLRHDCVVVPGFGAFINVRRSAEFDSSTSIYRPMEREVRFNGALIHDDGMLAHSYSRKYRISFQEGREMLMRDTESFIKMIEEDGEVTIGRLGVIRRNEESICYIPMKSPSKLAEETGLYNLRLRSLSDTSTSTREQTKAEVKHSRVFDTRKNYYIAINKVFARTAACFILVATVALALLNPPQPAVGIEDKASVVPVESIIHTAKEHISHSQSIKEPEAEQATIEENANGNTADDLDDTKEGNLYLIVGTFKSETEAKNYVASRSADLNELEIINSGKMWRVSSHRGNDRSELAGILRSADFKERFGEGWIWEAR